MQNEYATLLELPPEEITYRNISLVLKKEQHSCVPLMLVAFVLYGKAFYPKSEILLWQKEMTLLLCFLRDGIKIGSNPKTTKMPRYLRVLYNEVVPNSRLARFGLYGQTKTSNEEIEKLITLSNDNETLQTLCKVRNPKAKYKGAKSLAALLKETGFFKYPDKEYVATQLYPTNKDAMSLALATKALAKISAVGALAYTRKMKMDRVRLRHKEGLEKILEKLNGANEEAIQAEADAFIESRIRQDEEDLFHNSYMHATLICKKSLLTNVIAAFTDTKLKLDYAAVLPLFQIAYNELRPHTRHTLSVGRFGLLLGREGSETRYQANAIRDRILKAKLVTPLSKSGFLFAKITSKSQDSGVKTLGKLNGFYLFYREANSVKLSTARSITSGHGATIDAYVHFLHPKWELVFKELSPLYRERKHVRRAYHLLVEENFYTKANFDPTFSKSLNPQVPLAKKIARSFDENGRLTLSREETLKVLKELLSHRGKMAKYGMHWEALKLHPNELIAWDEKTSRKFPVEDRGRTKSGREKFSQNAESGQASLILAAAMQGVLYEVNEKHLSRIYHNFLLEASTDHPSCLYRLSQCLLDKSMGRLIGVGNYDAKKCFESKNYLLDSVFEQIKAADKVLERMNVPDNQRKGAMQIAESFVRRARGQAYGSVWEKGRIKVGLIEAPLIFAYFMLPIAELLAKRVSDKQVPFASIAGDDVLFVADNNVDQSVIDEIDGEFKRTGKNLGLEWQHWKNYQEGEKQRADCAPHFMPNDGTPAFLRDWNPSKRPIIHAGVAFAARHHLLAVTKEPEFDAEDDNRSALKKQTLRSGNVGPSSLAKCTLEMAEKRREQTDENREVRVFRSRQWSKNDRYTTGESRAFAALSANAAHTFCNTLDDRAYLGAIETERELSPLTDLQKRSMQNSYQELVCEYFLSGGEDRAKEKDDRKLQAFLRDYSKERELPVPKELKLQVYLSDLSLVTLKLILEEAPHPDLDQLQTAHTKMLRAALDNPATHPAGPLVHFYREVIAEKGVWGVSLRVKNMLEAFSAGRVFVTSRFSYFWQTKKDGWAQTRNGLQMAYFKAFEEDLEIRALQLYDTSSSNFANDTQTLIKELRDFAEGHQFPLDPDGALYKTLSLFTGNKLSTREVYEGFQKGREMALAYAQRLEDPMEAHDFLKEALEKRELKRGRYKKYRA